MKEDGALMTIGQVVDQLKSDFPDLSITKIRYLEDRALLAPSRTPGEVSMSARLATSVTWKREWITAFKTVFTRSRTWQERQNA